MSCSRPWLQALPHVLSARAHARQLSLDPLDAAASVALADIWLSVGAVPATMSGGHPRLL